MPSTIWWIFFKKASNLIFLDLVRIVHVESTPQRLQLVIRDLARPLVQLVPNHILQLVESDEAWRCRLRLVKCVIYELLGLLVESGAPLGGINWRADSSLQGRARAALRGVRVLKRQARPPCK